mmetsp:Transcript_1872/g.4116  ORF Transcript_1872/g.4116 Transcript_1872/m.4116 type:complete len:219 (-) Transcript_1872:172-828(-)
MAERSRLVHMDSPSNSSSLKSPIFEDFVIIIIIEDKILEEVGDELYVLVVEKVGDVLHVLDVVERQAPPLAAVAPVAPVEAVPVGIATARVRVVVHAVEPAAATAAVAPPVPLVLALPGEVAAAVVGIAGIDLPPAPPLRLPVLAAALPLFVPLGAVGVVARASVVTLHLPLLGGVHLVAIAGLVHAHAFLVHALVLRGEEVDVGRILVDRRIIIIGR